MSAKRAEMRDKRAIILNCVIKEYIKNLEPISSNYLQEKIDMKISSATIRNYLKKMVDEGKLEQPHISSGRIPTLKTLREYWQKNIDVDEKIDIKNQDSIKKYAKDYKVFCEYKFFEPNILKNVINYDNRYLILEFSKSEFILNYSEKIEKLFKEFIGFDSTQLIKICKEVGLVNLSKKINIVSNEPVRLEGLGEFLDLLSKNRDWGKRYMRSFLDGTILDELEDGLYFDNIVPNGYLAYKNCVKIKEQDAKLLFVGALNRDYENFIKKLRRG